MDKRSKPFLNEGLSGEGILKMLLVNWALGFGSVALLLLLSLFIPYLWLPFIAAGEALYLMRRRIPQCSLTEDGSLTTGFLRVSVWALWISAAVMLAIEILCTPFLVGRVLSLPMYNDELPFVTCLVVFPALALSAIWWLAFCRPRRRRPGEIHFLTGMRAMIPREAAYQVRIILLLSVLLGGVEAWYYLARYINSNLNAPDRFFFVIMPIGFYLLSLFFMAGRCTSLGAIVEAMGTLPSGSFSTLVRYIIFSDNELLVRPNHFGLYDTPAEVTRTGPEEVTEETVRKAFSRLAETDRFSLRYLFTSESIATNLRVLHYAAILDANLARSEIAPEDGDGAGDRWVGLYDIRRMASEGMLSPVLASELARIYAITMAWKTYNRSGQRLYPIRNYKPTFRFRDLGKWDVDYDDSTWLDIADFNEDKPFYRIRKHFRRRKHQNV